MKKKLLEEMVLFLRDKHPAGRIPEGGFDMLTWREDTPCGTIGCALGWATTLLPSYRKIYRMIDGSLTPLYHESQEEALDLTLEEFVYLFVPAKKEKPEIVAKRIEKFIADGMPKKAKTKVDA